MNSSRDIAVIFGGDCGERNTSIQSAYNVIRWLTEANFVPIPVRWDTAGWQECTTDDLEMADNRCDPVEVLQNLKRNDVGVVFNCIHGGPGEDGTLAAILSMFQMAHTGAGVVGGAVSGCKITFRQRMRGIGLRVPAGAVVHEEVWSRHQSDVLNGIDHEIHYPCFVKDPIGGSSQGIYLVNDRHELIAAIDKTLVISRLVLVEKRIRGREFSVPCLGGVRGVLPQILQPVEIRPEGQFFDEKEKYGEHEVICPAELDHEQWHNIAREIRQMHLELQLGTISRTDLIIEDGGSSVYLETNTVPGMTEKSLLPLCAQQTGISGPELVKKMIDVAVHEHLARHSGAASAG
ncbi:MAG: hypothetical protein AAEJ47_05540 [Planctomycetota bacterium]